jgi:hypothetical protein
MTINTRAIRKEIPRVFLLLKMSLCVTVYKAPDGGLEAEGTEQFSYSLILCDEEMGQRSLLLLKTFLTINTWEGGIVEHLIIVPVVGCA